MFCQKLMLFFKDITELHQEGQFQVTEPLQKFVDSGFMKLSDELVNSHTKKGQK